MCIRDSMDPEHLAEGSFPKDEKSVYESVSYTHLDVYKRQVCVCVCVCAYVRV